MFIGKKEIKIQKRKEKNIWDNLDSLNLQRKGKNECAWIINFHWFFL